MSRVVVPCASFELPEILCRERRIAYYLPSQESANLAQCFCIVAAERDAIFPLKDNNELAVVPAQMRPTIRCPWTARTVRLLSGRPPIAPHANRRDTRDQSRGDQDDRDGGEDCWTRHAPRKRSRNYVRTSNVPTWDVSSTRLRLALEIWRVRGPLRRISEAQLAAVSLRDSRPYAQAGAFLLDVGDVPGGPPGCPPGEGIGPATAANAGRPSACPLVAKGQRNFLATVTGALFLNHIVGDIST